MITQNFLKSLVTTFNPQEHAKTPILSCTPDYRILPKLNIPLSCIQSDGVTKEHIRNAGFGMVRMITLILNWILETEYIPINFRRGVQIPLYKGKNTSTLDVNNYRDITLLSIFNKLFEVVMWKRMEQW